jgi:hypothetical protein
VHTIPAGIGWLVQVTPPLRVSHKELPAGPRARETGMAL